MDVVKHLTMTLTTVHAAITANVSDPSIMSLISDPDQWPWSVTLTYEPLCLDDCPCPFFDCGLLDDDESDLESGNILVVYNNKGERPAMFSFSGITCSTSYTGNCIENWITDISFQRIQLISNPWSTLPSLLLKQAQGHCILARPWWTARWWFSAERAITSIKCPLCKDVIVFPESETCQWTLNMVHVPHLWLRQLTPLLYYYAFLIRIKSHWKSVTGIN